MSNIWLNWSFFKKKVIKKHCTPLFFVVDVCLARSIISRRSLLSYIAMNIGLSWKIITMHTTLVFVFIPKTGNNFLKQVFRFDSVYCYRLIWSEFFRVSNLILLMGALIIFDDRLLKKRRNEMPKFGFIFLATPNILIVDYLKLAKTLKITTWTRGSGPR